ncbi:hypothetical protein K6U56_12295 [Vibrio furnissii]|uniref:hypothetical protein n=1 Tax=Vibrio furnissii TaxID=29494 RepID=UPI001302D7E5|nr:hypothetical protein [Vibrio furnissii]MCG6212744.1 hypothetical protein [Vibrio furnissii]
MRILTGLPEPFDLPTSIADEVISHINQPFDDAAQASQYWQVYSCALVLIEASEEPKAWGSMPSSTQEQVFYALEYPEYIDVIGDYELSLAITNDEGAVFTCFVIPVSTKPSSRRRLSMQTISTSKFWKKLKQVKGTKEVVIKALLLFIVLSDERTPAWGKGMSFWALSISAVISDVSRFVE